MIQTDLPTFKPAGARAAARHRIQFPPASSTGLSQDEAYFYLLQDGQREQVRLHDYERLYQVPGLYEQVVYDRLKCESPMRVADVLAYAVSMSDQRLSTVRVLDLGAGNGMAGEALVKRGIARLVGIDVIEEAKVATERDRPGLYDAYFVCDFTSLSPEMRDELDQWSLDCLVSVAALGFGDIPVRAFVEAFNAISDDGWVAFNIKKSFLDPRDTSGFSRLIRELLFSKYLDLYHLQRYQHRLSIEGEPLYYFALGARKNANVPLSLLDALEREAPASP